MESKELKDLRRGMVTRTATINRISIEYINADGMKKCLVQLRGEYSAEDLKRKLEIMMFSRNALLLYYQILESVHGLYGMEEDEFFENAKLLKEIEK